MHSQAVLHMHFSGHFQDFLSNVIVSLHSMCEEVGVNSNAAFALYTCVGNV